VTDVEAHVPVVDVDARDRESVKGLALALLRCCCSGTRRTRDQRTVADGVGDSRRTTRGPAR
jgi:hypothetical protein